STRCSRRASSSTPRATCSRAPTTRTTGTRLRRRRASAAARAIASCSGSSVRSRAARRSHAPRRRLLAAVATFASRDARSSELLLEEVLARLLVGRAGREILAHREAALHRGARFDLRDPAPQVRAILGERLVREVTHPREARD